MIDRLVAFQAKVRPHAPALSTPFGSASFGELERDVARMERALMDTPGFADVRRVGVQIVNPVHFWLVALGCWRLGRTVVSLARAEGERHAQLLSLTRPEILFCDREQPGAIARLVTQRWIDQALASPSSPSQGEGLAPDEEALVLTSSGTTGEPKPLAFTRGQLEWLCRRRAMTEITSRRSMTTMGLDSVGGALTAPGVWSRGGCMVYPAADFRWVDVFAGGDIDLLTISPAQAARILQELPADFQGAGHIALLVGGSALPASLAHALRTRVTPRLYILYGSTEAGLVTMTPHGRVEGIEGAVGYVVPGAQVLEIVDASGAAVRSGAPGEVRLRGPNLPTRYDGETQSDAFRDGAFHPGDIGRLNDDGLLVIEGRASEFLNIGGEKYAPFGIEEALRACEGVHDAAAFAAPGADGLSEAHAAIVADDRFRREAAHALIVGRYPVLTLELHGVAAIPRNAMGKIDRAALRRMILPKAPS